MLSILIVKSIKLVDKIIVPQSRLRREMNKWIRYLGNHPDEVIYITRNGFETNVLISPEKMEELNPYANNI